MQEIGWLTWAPKVGRNQRSTLTLHYSLKELKTQLAAVRVRAGKYEKALAILDHDQTAFSQLLTSTSGASMREGRLHIQLTYKRPFERLVPHQLHRSSERYLMRQIYCCLVGSSADGQLEPQLAHHWHYNEETLEWTFYLRPALTFHDGSTIDAEGIANLFEQLKLLPLYHQELAHVVAVSAPQNNKVVFQLANADLGFGGLISGVKYGIQPASQINRSGHAVVVGSGPFTVTEHSDAKLCLQAFERYYACRALTDQVTIWQFDEAEPIEQQIETNQPEATMTGCHYYLSRANEDTNTKDALESKVEDGCLFVLFNHNAKAPLSAAQCRYLSDVISPDTVRDQLKRDDTLFGSVVAHNLLPRWNKIVRPSAPTTSLPKQLSIAVYDYSALKHCALAIKTLLEALGVQVVVNSYSYRDLYQQAAENRLTESLVLTNINLDDNRHASAFNSLYHNPILQNCMGDTAHLWLTQALNQLRSHTPLPDYLDALEPIASSIIHQYWLLPLFHHQQTLRFHGVLKDVALTNWGWPDIRNVWSAD